MYLRVTFAEDSPLINFKVFSCKDLVERVKKREREEKEKEDWYGQARRKFPSGYLAGSNRFGNTSYLKMKIAV